MVSSGGYKKQFHMLVGAEQAREVVTLVTSEAPFSITVGRDVVS